jgi:hypothetical protein
LTLLSRTLLRPLLAIVTASSVVYDLAAVAAGKLRGHSPQAVRERRNTRREFISTSSGFEALNGVQKAAHKTGAQVFLVSGTLLGLHRDGALLAHDYDVDVGIMSDDPALPAFLDAVRAIPGHVGEKAVLLSPAECALNPWLAWTPDKPILYKHFFQSPAGHGTSFGVDVFVHFKANGYLAHANYRCLWINKEFALREQHYAGHAFLVPDDVDGYLRENYGDYRTENRSFENSTDCPNSTNLYGFRPVMWLSGRYAHFIASQEPHKRRIIGSRLWDCIRYGLFLSDTPRWRMDQYQPTRLDSTKPPR